MKVILVRHAETEWNKLGIIQGHLDSPVTDRGEQETSALLAALTAEAYPVECIYSSPLGRARYMSQALVSLFHCPLVLDDALKEQNFGQYEGVALQHLNGNFHIDAIKLFTDDAMFCPDRGESLADASQRVVDFLHHLGNTTQFETICIVSHGQVIQGAVARLKEGKIENFSRYAHPNASYSILEMIDGKCLSLRWGVASHLLKLSGKIFRAIN